MPGQTLQHPRRVRRAPGTGEERIGSPASIARELGVHRSTVKRWLDGDRTTPDWAREALGRPAESAQQAADRLIATVRSQPPRTVREWDQVLAPAEQRILRIAIADGTFVLAPIDRVDSAGRRYPHQGVFSGAGARRRGLDRSAPRVPGGALAAARRYSGVSAEELAGRMGLASSTIRDYEASPAIPRARLRELTEALGLAEALNGGVISDQRKSAGWTLKQVADRTGVTLSVIHTWESGKRPVPDGRLILLAAALQAAVCESPALQAKRRRDLVEKVIEDVATHPGSTRRAVAHRLRSLSLGRMGPRFDGMEAIGEALGSGEIVEAVVAIPGPRGRPRELPRLYLPDAVPAGHDAPALTGNELLARRGQLGVSQRELGAATGVSQAMIGYFERRGVGRLPRWQSARLSKALNELASRPDADSEAREAVLSAIHEDPGIARYRLLSRLGHTNPVRRQLESLVRAGDIVAAPRSDSQGRECLGFYLRGAEPAPVARFEPGELRDLIRANGWTATELAAALGIRPNRISRWETGVRQCSPGWCERIRAELQAAEPR